MLTLDLVNEEDVGMLDDEQDEWMNNHEVILDKLIPARRRAGTDVSRPPSSITDAKVNTGSLPRQSEFSHSYQSHTPPNKKVLALCRNRCTSMDDALSKAERKTTKKEALAQSPTDHLQDLIAQRLQRTQELLAEIQEQKPHRDRMGSYPHLKGIDSPRLQHLKGSDSPHSEGSSSHSSPHSRGTESPSFKGKESPHAKSKDSPRFKASKSKSNFRSKSIDSPNSKESSSPHTKCIDLTHIKGSDSPLSIGSHSPHSKCTDPVFFRVSYSPQVKNNKGTDSPFIEALDWDSRRVAAELLQEAISSWREAREILAEVKELQARQQRAEPIKTETPSQCRKQKNP